MEFDFTQIQPFWNWLFPGALLNYVLILAALVVGVVVIGWILSLVRHGPQKGFAWLVTLFWSHTRHPAPGKKNKFVAWLYTFFLYGIIETIEQIGAAIWWLVGDLIMISPRRVAALTWLAVKESIRRRVVVVVGLFILLILFAGWFLQPDSSNPAQVYISFVMTSTSYLILLLTLVLCSLSLPADLKNRTLHTIVTKPVRPSEIILGRIFGFIAIGTMLLAVMGTVSYFFVIRGLSHSHTFDATALRPVEGTSPENPTLSAKTNTARHHFHTVTVDPDGNAQVELSQSHTHAIEAEHDADGKVTACTIGPTQRELTARVPIFGTLSFLDRAGQKTEKGISVGKEWAYRSYIEGGTKQAAIWKFQGVSEELFPDGLPVAMQISIFRSWKGIIEKGILGSLSVHVPGTDQWIEPVLFTAKDSTIDVQHIPRELHIRDPKNPDITKKIDLFEDIVRDGEIEIQLRCMEPAQYFGVAQADVYLHTPDAPFFLNFLKGYLGIWLQMSLLTALGVFFSTFLSGPVALLSTAGLMVGGLWHDFLFKLATGQTFGGGPFESLVRLATQDNVISEMTPGLRTTFVQSLDSVFLVLLRALAALLPDFQRFSLVDFVSNGFNIPGDMMAQSFASAAAFIIPVFIASYFCFKMREVAK